MSDSESVVVATCKLFDQIADLYCELQRNQPRLNFPSGRVNFRRFKSQLTDTLKSIDNILTEEGKELVDVVKSLKDYEHSNAAIADESVGNNVSGSG